MRTEDSNSWFVSDETRVISTFENQAEAIDRARNLVASQGGGEVVIHASGETRTTIVSESRGFQLSRIVGGAVLRHRKAAGLTRSELSDLSGVGATAIYQIETGHPTVRLETLVSVLDVLNIKLGLRSSLEGDIA